MFQHTSSCLYRKEFGFFFMSLLFCIMLMFMFKVVYLSRSTKKDCSKIKRIWFVFINKALCTKFWKPKVDGPYINDHKQNSKICNKKPRVPGVGKEQTSQLCNKNTLARLEIPQGLSITHIFPRKINNKLWPEAPDLVLSRNGIKYLTIKLTFII